jgi:nucleoside-specific outer membrane channel protein Tsx
MCISQVSLTAPLWSDLSATYVAGNGFTLDPEKQQTVTLEHAAGYGWGDTFTYLDTTFFRGDERAYSFFGETAARWSLADSDQDRSNQAVTDMLISVSLEFGSGTVETFTLGPSVDLNVPAFDYLHLGLMRRQSLNRSGFNNSDGWQLVPTWSLTIPAGRSEWVIDGFAKWIFATDHSDYHANFQFNPQIKYNVGKHLSNPDRRVYLGVEYYYWSNKYGVKSSPELDSDQHAVSFIAKYHF